MIDLTREKDNPLFLRAGWNTPLLSKYGADHLKAKQSEFSFFADHKYHMIFIQLKMIT